MKPEQLKDKLCVCNPDIWEVDTLHRTANKGKIVGVDQSFVFLKDDLKSAVEWLKGRLRFHRKNTNLSETHYRDILVNIGEAFEDLTKEVADTPPTKEYQQEQREERADLIKKYGED